MKKLIFASNNKNKISEIRFMLPDFEILSLEDIGFLDDIVEDGNSFEENSLIKSRQTQKFLEDHNMAAWVLADDSGLCIDALGGAPGIYSARYAGDHDPKAGRAKILRELEGIADRNAHFVCCMSLISPDGKEYVFEGQTHGKILTEETGTNGFGFDCLFVSDDLGKCFGLCSKEEKNSVSHRSRALRKVVEFLKNI